MPRIQAGKRNISFTVTEAQNAALDAALQGDEKAAFVRRAIQEAVKRRGLTWPDDYPERGKYPRK